jgi:signal transduction histidine kinase
VIRRLYLRIYLATLGSLTSVFALFAVLWHLANRQPGGRQAMLTLHLHVLQGHIDGLTVVGAVVACVGLAMYPVVRRLTREFDALAASMQRFGEGDLTARAPVEGADEVARLGTTFNAMADRVGALLEAHSRMLANASHELRSPLARIRLALELHAGSPDDALLADIHRDCAEIDGQLEEILLASKLDTVGRVVDEAVDLAALLAEESTRANVPFDAESADVRGDPRLLRRALRNLLENAVTHGQAGVAATLQVDGPDAVVRVSDRGPGIPLAERERIFEPFYRPAQSSETGTGWGLGLALVRQIATQHQGTVRCLARDGGGCVFELRVPACMAPDPR